MVSFPESDWRVLTRFKPLALDRLCKRYIDKAENLSRKTTDSNYYQAYLELYKSLGKAEKSLDLCFNDWRRSTAIYTLANWQREKLLTEQEYQQFSQETQNNANLILSLSV
jgi:hypothetical protein